MASRNRKPMFQRLVLLLLFGAGSPVAATDLQQVITLKPGWNAVHVHIEPNQRDLDTLFAGIPVLSVWRWLPTRGDSQFIRDPAEGLENLEGWFGWFPEPRPEAFLSNLFRMDGNTAYLIRLGGAQNRQLILTGKPRFRTPRWEPNAFTLTGLAVDPSQPPTFAEFFSVSAAHQGQPVFALGADGRWQEVVSPTTTTIQSGEAYWFWTQGRSNYQGRLHVVLDQGDSLEYSAALEEIRVVLRNRSGVNGSFLIERLGADPLPLLFRNEDPETGEIGWPTLQPFLMVDAPTDEDVFVTLAVSRRGFTSDRMDDIVSIRDEHGQRVLLYAGGNTIQPGGGVAGATLMAKTAGPTLAGLWVGEVSIDAVSEAQRAGTLPTPTGRDFIQRFLIHVDAIGQARLLKDVIQMWEEGTMVPSSIDPTRMEVDQPGRFVLLTNKHLIGLYTGAALRGGQPVGIRFSTVAYDFADETLALVGAFGPTEQLSGTIVIEPELPTNPFLHRYHPDHDNLDEQFLNFRLEAYQVVRNIQLRFTVDDPLGRNPPGWGDTVVGGVFSESMTGLHKNTIFTSGLFRLRRVSAVPVLNQ